MYVVCSGVGGPSWELYQKAGGWKCLEMTLEILAGAGWQKAFFKINSFIYILFLAVLGLRCCARAFSSCSEQGLLFIVARGLLIAVASLVAEHRLQ